MLKLAALSAMPETERAQALGKLVAKAKGKPNGGMAALDARIRGYETKYSLTSADMRRHVASNEIEENDDIAHWLMLLSVRARGQ